MLRPISSILQIYHIYIAAVITDKPCFLNMRVKLPKKQGREFNIQERFEDSKGVIRIRKSKKNRQQNGQKDKQRSTKRTHKTTDRVIRTLLKTGVNSGSPKG